MTKETCVIFTYNWRKNYLWKERDSSSRIYQQGDRALQFYNRNRTNWRFLLYPCFLANHQTSVSTSAASPVFSPSPGWIMWSQFSIVEYKGNRWMCEVRHPCTGRLEYSLSQSHESDFCLQRLYHSSSYLGITTIMFQLSQVSILNRRLSLA